MPESPAHARLVQAMVEFVGAELGGIINIALREDAVIPLRGERPPRIGGFVPDLYAVDVPTTRTIIGEAKTRADLESDHSVQQISAFLQFLRETAGGTFVLAVPITAAATARRFLDQLSAEIGSETVRTVVLDGIMQADTPVGDQC